MQNFFLSPIPFIILFLMFVFLTSDLFKSKKINKIGKYITAIFFIITVLYWFESLSAKVCDGRLGYHAHLVSSVTMKVEDLLNQGKYEEAKNILNKFNEYYPLNSRSEKDLEQFMVKYKIDHKSLKFNDSTNKSEQTNALDRAGARSD